MMDSMMKKGKGMCDSMMSNMSGMDAMMAKGKLMCDDMMGSSDKNNATNSSCSANKESVSKTDDESCRGGSCEL